MSDYTSNVGGILHFYADLAAVSSGYPLHFYLWHRFYFEGAMNQQITIKPNGTVVGRAAALDLIFSKKIVAAIFFLVWVIGIGSAAALLLHLLLDSLTNIGIGLCLIGLSIFMNYFALRIFYFGKVKYPKITTLAEVKSKILANAEVNIYSIFSFHLSKAVLPLFKSKSGDSITTKELALALLNSKDMIFILMRLGVGTESLRQSLDSYQSTLGITPIVLRAVDIALSETHHQIEIGDIFVALCEQDPFFKEFLINLKLEVKDIDNLVYWRTNIVREIVLSKSFFNPIKLRMNGGIGKDWAFGYTPMLRRYSTDLTDSIRSYGLQLEIFGKDKAVTEIEEALLHEHGGNVIVVGEPGIGKKTAVMAFANKVYQGKINQNLAYYHIVKVNADALISDSGSLSQLLNEIIRAGNIIVFIENIQNLFSTGGAGKADQTELLLPYLDSPNIKVIGTCDTASFDQFFMMKSALMQRFTRVTLNEPADEDMVRILEDVAPQIEAHTGSIISYTAIKVAINSADKYILNQPNPQKTISLIDGAAAKATSARKGTIILPKDIYAYVTEKYDIPSSEVGNEERAKLLHLGEEMHKYVIGQNQAIEAIASSLKRTRAGVTDTKKPIGSFLFLGPTGVGKTETAKALARAYFGSEDRMIRFDMSEYQNKEDIYRFIGSNLHGEEVQGALATAVREHPFSLLLFDEIEKANRDILDLFLQILDEGHLTDGTGKKVSFTSTIIITTSNAGANLIRESIATGADYENTKKELMDYLQKNNIYRPEFINRFTSVVAFSPISPSEAKQIAQLMIEKLKKTVALNRQVSLTVTDDAVDYLSKAGYDPQMGARPMARIIQEKVENYLAEKFLSEELKQGGSITVSAKDIDGGGATVPNNTASAIENSDQKNLPPVNPPEDLPPNPPTAV